MGIIHKQNLKENLIKNGWDNAELHKIIDNEPEFTIEEPAILVPTSHMSESTNIEQTTTSVSAMSGIPWKKVRKLVNDSIAAGANVDISCEADGSWSVAIYPPEKHEYISVPVGNTIYANNAHGLPIKPPSDSISG